MLPANLRRLVLNDVDYGELTLGCCTALESLLLVDTWHAGMQPGLANMHILRSYAVPGTSDFQLGGPVLEGLERLLIETPAAIRHASALARATRLHTLGLVDADYEDHSKCWLAALRMVTTLPALRHLALGGCGTYLPRLIEPLLELQRRRPHLKVSCDFVIEDVSEGDEERQRMLSFFGLRMPWLNMDFQEFIA